MYHNVQVGYPIVPVSDLIPCNEFNETLVTSTRYLPKIMVEAGIISHTSEVSRNRPDLCITFPSDMTDCIEIKWGNKFLYIIIGKKTPVNFEDIFMNDEEILGCSFNCIDWHVKDSNNFNGHIYEEKICLMHRLRNGVEVIGNSTPSWIYLLWR